MVAIDSVIKPNADFFKIRTDLGGAWQQISIFEPRTHLDISLRNTSCASLRMDLYGAECRSSSSRRVSVVANVR